MKSTRVLLTLSTLLGLALTGYYVVKAADKNKRPNIKQLMEKSHKGKTSPLAKLGKELGKQQPDWPMAQAYSRDLMVLGDALARMKVVAYRSTKQYVISVRALDGAVKKKDHTRASAALKDLTGTCAKCHKYGR